MDRYLPGSPRNSPFHPSIRTPDLTTPPCVNIARSLPSRNSPMPPYASQPHGYPTHSDFERSQSWPSVDKINQDVQRGNFLSPNLSTPPPLHHISPHMPSVSPRSYASDIEEPSNLLKYGIISRAASAIHASPGIRHGIDAPKKSSDFLFPSPKERPPSAFSPRAFSPGGFSVPSPFSPGGGFSPCSFSPGSIAESYYQAASKYGTEIEEQTAPLKLKISPKRELDFSDQEDQPRDLRKNSFSENWSPSPVNPSNDASLPSPKFPYGVRLPPKKARYGYNGPNPSPGSTSSSASDRHEPQKVDSPAPQLQLPRAPSPVALRVLNIPERTAQWAESQLNQDSVAVPMLPDFAPPSKVLHHHATPIKTSPSEPWQTDQDRYFAHRSLPPSMSQIWQSSQYLPPSHVEQTAPRGCDSDIFHMNINTSSAPVGFSEPVFSETLRSKDVQRPKRGRPKKIIQVDPTVPAQLTPQRKRGKKKVEPMGHDEDGASSPVPQVKYVPTPMVKAGKFEISKNVLDVVLSRKKLELLSSSKVILLISQLSKIRHKKK